MGDGRKLRAERHGDAGDRREALALTPGPNAGDEEWEKWGKWTTAGQWQWDDDWEHHSEGKSTAEADSGVDLPSGAMNESSPGRDGLPIRGVEQ